MPVAVVTGANRGLGLETASELAQRGYRVWLTGRDPELTAQSASALREQKFDVQGAALDVTSAAGVGAFAQRMSSEPPIDVLVNNAGASLKGFDLELATQTLEINYRGAVRVTDALLPRLTESANIVMVSSGMGELSHYSAALKSRFLAARATRADVEAIAEEFLSAVSRGDCGGAGFPSNAYRVSKALMNAFTRVLSREFEAAHSKRRANAVCPGWVHTRMGGSGAPRSLEQGASGIVWAATLAEAGPRGGFFRDGKSLEW